MSKAASMIAVSTSPVSRLEQGSLSLRCYVALRQSLMEGRFRPGERLVVQDLAEMMGASATPVREACLRLVSEQALELRSGRFVTVPDLTVTRLTELMTIRIALEGLAAELAASRISQERIDELRKINEKYVSAEKGRNTEAAITANRQFHFGACEASGLGMLFAQIETLWVSMGPIHSIYYGGMPLIHFGGEEHINVLRAFADRDGVAAREALQRDIKLGAENILSFIQRNGA